MHSANDIHTYIDYVADGDEVWMPWKFRTGSDPPSKCESYVACKDFVKLLPDDVDWQIPGTYLGDHT